MELLDSRRLTGPNLLWDRPSAVIDVRFGIADPDSVIQTWHKQLNRMLDAVGWPPAQTAVHRVEGGASLAFAAPIDALYAATDINDWAWEATCRQLESGPDANTEADAVKLRETIAQQRNPPLLALRDAAVDHDVPFLSDDDHASVGLGHRSRTFPINAMPTPTDIDWSSLGSIPIGLVTGTNGKTTSVRLAAAIARAAGHTVGLSSTDWIAVNDDIIDRGDYSGPGGARTVLRDGRVTLAILETARGGLLRRGLSVTHADAALITNIAEDHLDDFSVTDLDQLADVKWLVTHALDRNGCAVLNADEPRLVERAGRDVDFRLLWFSLDPPNPVVRSHVDAGGSATTVEDNSIVYYRDGIRERLMDVSDVPVTLGGAARHNVANALGATGLMLALGVSQDAVVAGLKETHSDANPGRCNLFHVDGVAVLVDFAHNPHGLHAIFELARAYPAKKRLLIIGQAGDRSNDAIRELTAAAWEIGLDHVVVKEMARYARGRDKGEVPELIRTELMRLGAQESAVSYQEFELDAVRETLDRAEEGDLVIMLIHEQMDEVIKLMEARQNDGRSPPKDK
ncbi:MAG: Mur ligase family protein [Gammaproteobacteria bacterium]